MLINKIKPGKLMTALLALSIILYAFRGKLGAIFITGTIILTVIVVFRQKMRSYSVVNVFTAFFLILFAVLFHVLRSVSPQYYLIVGYLAAALLLLDTREAHLKDLWKWLRLISLFEAAGIFLQLLIPGLYYRLMGIILSPAVIAGIKERRSSGYYTGFSHEVSFTMFLIVVGLGLYLYEAGLKNNYKKWLPIAFLFAALFVSGKRATLVFFVGTVFLVQYVIGERKGRLMKYGACAVAGVLALWVFYPVWSRIPALHRINEFVQYFAAGDLAGMTSGRTAIYENAIKLWNTNRWFGIGWGNFKYMVPDTAWYSGFDVHNCFLQILCETGIIGLVFYAFICTASIVNSIKCINCFRRQKSSGSYNLAVFCCYMQMFFILYSLTEPILYEYTDYVIFFVCFGCTNLLLKKRKKLIGSVKMKKDSDDITYGKIAG